MLKQTGVYAPHILELAHEAGVDAFRDRYLSDQEGAVTELQDRYYPDSWMFSVPEESRPVATYRVVCTTPAELALAYALKPQGVNADITLAVR